jgi:hypothetical protein
VDASRWPRLTVHPARFSDHDWVRRALGHDRAVTTNSRLDEQYRVIAAQDISDDQLRELFTESLVSWWLAQEPEVIMDVEDHGEHGGYLAVAHLGIGIGNDQLTMLYEQAKYLLAAYGRAMSKAE